MFRSFILIAIFAIYLTAFDREFFWLKQKTVDIRWYNIEKSLNRDSIYSYSKDLSLFKLKPKKSLYLYVESGKFIKILPFISKNLEFSFSQDGVSFITTKLPKIENYYLFDSFLKNKILKITNKSDKKEKFALFENELLETKNFLYNELLDLNLTEHKISRKRDATIKSFYYLENNRTLNLKFDKEIDRVKVEYRIPFERGDSLVNLAYLNFKIDNKILTKRANYSIDKFNEVYLDSNISYLSSELTHTLNLNESRELNITSSKNIYLRILTKSDFLFNQNSQIESLKSDNLNNLKYSELKRKYQKLPLKEYISLLKRSFYNSFHRELLPTKVDNLIKIEQIEYLHRFVNRHRKKIYLNREFLKDYNYKKNNFITFKDSLKYQIPQLKEDTRLKIAILNRKSNSKEIELSIDSKKYKISLIEPKRYKFLKKLSQVNLIDNNITVVELELPKDTKEIKIRAKKASISLGYLKKRDFRLDIKNFKHLTKSMNQNELLERFRAILSNSYEKNLINLELELHFRPLVEFLKSEYEQFFKLSIEKKSNIIYSKNRYKKLQKKLSKESDIFKKFEILETLTKDRTKAKYIDYQLRKVYILLELKEVFLAKELLKRAIFHTFDKEAISIYQSLIDNDLRVLASIVYKNPTRENLESLKKRASPRVANLIENLLLKNEIEVEAKSLEHIKKIDGFENIYSPNRDKNFYLMRGKNIELKLEKNQKYRLNTRFTHNKFIKKHRYIKLIDGNRVVDIPITSIVSQNLELNDKKESIGDNHSIYFIPKNRNVKLISIEDILISIEPSNSPKDTLKSLKNNSQIDLIQKYETTLNKKHFFELERDYLLSQNYDNSIVNRAKSNFIWKSFTDFEEIDSIEYRNIDLFTPISPILKIRKALFDRKDIKNILFADSTIEFSLDEPKKLNIYLYNLDLDLIEKKPVNICYKINSKEHCKKFINHKKLSIFVRDSISIYLKNPESNTFVAVSLNDKIEPTKQLFYVTTKKHPIKFFSKKDSFYKILKIENGKSKTEYILTDSAKEIEIYPDSTKALVKLYEREYKRAKERFINILKFNKSENLAEKEIDYLDLISKNVEHLSNEDGTLSFKLEFIERRDDNDLEPEEEEDDEEGEDDEKESDDEYKNTFFKASLIYRYFDGDLNYHRGDIFYRTDDIFGFKYKFLHRFKNYPYSYTFDIETLAQSLNKLRHISTIKNSITHFLKLNQKFTNSFTGSIFFRCLSEKDEIDGLNRDIFTEYKDEHRYGYLLADTMKYRAFLDTFFIFRSKLSSNINLKIDKFENSIEVVQLFRELDFSLKYTNKLFFKDEDREESYDKNYIDLTLLFDSLYFGVNRFNIGLNLKYDIDDSETLGSIFLNLDFSKGRVYRDYIPYEIDFLDLKNLKVLTND